MVDNDWFYINWNIFCYVKTAVVTLKFISSLVVLRNYGKNKFVFLIKKLKIWGLAFVLSAPAADKREYFLHLSFNSTLQLINDISNDFQNS